jgi:hypothetical protein
MGSLIKLRLGNLEVDWGKNHNFVDHRPLFQSGDLAEAEYLYIDDTGQPVSENREAYRKPLRDVLPRIELLGHTLATAAAEYASLRDDFGRGKALSFERLIGLVKLVDAESVSLDYSDDHDFGEFFAEEILPRIGLEEYLPGPAERHYFGEMMENFHPWSALRLLAERPANLALPVVWSFADVVEGGWEEGEFFVPVLPQGDRFLLVTEGSSDARILRKALDLLKPAVSDFFYFVDMEEGYPFTGTGNLANFCKGLASIGVLNNVLVIFDNDAEGVYKSKQVQDLNRPCSMGVTVLPSLPELTAIETIGPSGRTYQDINGRAASIEAYLDLTWKTQSNPVVRWSAYQQQLDRYQGALVAKVDYAKQFLALSSATSGYDFSKLNVVLDQVVKLCVSIVTRKHNSGINRPPGSLSSADGPPSLP